MPRTNETREQQIVRRLSNLVCAVCADVSNLRDFLRMHPVPAWCDQNTGRTYQDIVLMLEVNADDFLAAVCEQMDTMEAGKGTALQTAMRVVEAIVKE